MEMLMRYCWLALALLFARAHAEEAACSSYGVDYSNGGAYYIDGSSNQYFSFITVFQGCNQESVSPILVGPDDNEYACSAVNTQPSGTQVTSTCGIPYSAMRSGTWRIIVQSSQIAVQRTITLTVGVPQTVVTTATPTVVLGITSTPRAQTIQSTITQTVTLIVVGPTVTSACNGGTRTVTNYPQDTTVTLTSTVTRTNQNGVQTSFWTTTVSTTASCHYPSSVYTSYTSYDNNPITSAAPTFCIGDNNCQPVWGGKGKGWGWGGGGRGNRPPSNSAAAEKRDVAGAASVAAFTSTYTETTYTVTSTVITTIPARTTTELVLRTTTTTVTPAATTVCLNGGQGGTVTVIRGNPTTVTQTNLVYQTTQVSGTIWIGQTQYTTFTNSASATACWGAGGWFGV